jgi:hypothetical protein
VSRKRIKLPPQIWIIFDEVTKEMWGPLDEKTDGWVTAPGDVYLYETEAEARSRFAKIQAGPQKRLCAVIGRYDSKSGDSIPCS